MRPVLILVLACVIGPGGLANGPFQDEQRADEPQPADWYKHVGRMIESFRSLGSWDEHYAYSMAAIERVFDRNGWDSEADTFALDLVREVEALPPWALQERFDMFVGVLSDRYLLNEEQETVLRQTVTRESNALFARHAGRILEYASEVIQTRASGEAITAEQVARWTEIAMPVFEDSRRALNAASERLLEHLDPEQQAIVRRDLEAANHRMAWIDNMRERWAAGDWQSSDWGMDTDPIQLAGEARARGEEVVVSEAPTTAAVASGATGAPSSQPSEPTTDKPKERTVFDKGGDDPWARYVRNFIRKYKLDDAQQQRAWSMYRNIKDHGDRVRKRYARQIELLGRRLAKQDDEKARLALQTQVTRRDAALKRLFDQLKRRLERLPTSAQRRDAEPIDLEPAPKPAGDPHPSDGP